MCCCTFQEACSLRTAASPPLLDTLTRPFWRAGGEQSWPLGVCSWKCFWGVRAFGVGQKGPRRGVRVKIHPSPNFPRLAMLPSMRRCGEMVEGLEQGLISGKAVSNSGGKRLPCMPKAGGMVGDRKLWGSGFTETPTSTLQQATGASMTH